MPRGRHRQAPPLHRILFPLTVGGTAVALAGGSWAVGDPMVLRAVVAATATAAFSGAVLLRRWDRYAGRRVAELKAARQRDEWRTDERIAELEVELEESRELRQRLENKLRAKRAELGRLRSEHADLLRRYATAESERARTLEDRRRLALSAGSAASGEIRKATPALRLALDSAAFARAEEALLELTRNGARQQVARTIEEARRRDVDAGGDERAGRHSADRRSLPALPMREHRGVSEVAAAVLPYSQSRQAPSRAQGGFDFFGTTGSGSAGHGGPGGEGGERAGGDQKAEKTGNAGHAGNADKAGNPDKAGKAAEDDGRHGDDLADVVGEEALAEHRAGNVIDLTAHDETEQLDMRQLRTTRTS